MSSVEDGYCWPLNPRQRRELEANPCGEPWIGEVSEQGELIRITCSGIELAVASTKSGQKLIAAHNASIGVTKN